MSENEPAKVETPARVTPMMRQYLELKEEHPDCILFFRLGDFYEMFFEDAVVASELLEITLTSRDKGEDGVPMCGVPHHSARGYIARLVNEGYKVAICEQVEPPGGKKLVKREVIQVVTPGLVTDLEMVDAKAPRYLFTTVEEGNGRFGFAYFDVTTGEFRVGEAPNVNALSEEISRIEPHEILLLESVATVRPAWAPPHTPITPVPDKWAEPAKAKARILEHYGVGDLGGFGLDDSPGGVRAAGILLAYVGSRHKAALGGVRPISRHLFGDAMFLGETTKKNLELFVTLSGQQKRGTLLSVIDRTRTAMGGRKLRRWVTFPLMDVGEINRRLDAVSELVNRGSLRKSVVERLRGVGDIERLAARIAIGNANARDLLLLKDSLMLLPEVSAISGETDAPLLKEVASGLDHLPALCTLLERAIAASPPPSLTEGGIIKDGYSEKVDELREIQHGGKSWISSLQAKERERTGISTLKIGFNKVFGYYIEVSRAKAAAVPEEYDRRQTLANAERYITPELKEMEAKVLGAEERAAKLEYELFLEVREAAAGYLDALRETADAVSTLDILAALAAVAVAKRFVRPTLHDGYELSIIGGRHPMVEELADGERFVPNDVKFDEEANRLLVITGPNM
ncbi:MAG: DNA mismatch repair protein MutS, partial [Deltaproteobacteria bacterium]